MQLKTQIEKNLHSHPSLLLVAFYDALADEQLAQTISKSWVSWMLWLLSSSYGLVYLFEQLLGGIREAFVVAARERNHAARFAVKQRRITHQLTIGAVAVADPEIVR